MSLSVRILAGRLDRGAGSHVYHNELARRLAARGHRVSVVCFASAAEVAACAAVTAIPPRRYEQSRWLWRVSTICKYLQCSRDLHRAPLEPVDVVVGGEHLFLKSHYRRFPRTPWIYLPHALSVSEEIDHALPSGALRKTSRILYRHLQGWALEHSSCTVRFTASAQDFLARAYPRRQISRFLVNPIGVDLPLSSATPAGDGVPRLLAVGRLSPIKGFDIALQALSRLKHQQWHLTILGDGELRPQLQRQAASAGIADRVTFVGHVADPAPWYVQSDLLLFPSRSESLGMVALEAMSHGLPCLAFRADGRSFFNVNEELIEHGRTGLLAANEAEFCVTLGQALRDLANLTRLGRAAREEVSNRYSWDRHLQRYEALFEDLLARERPPP